MTTYVAEQPGGRQVIIFRDGDDDCITIVGSNERGLIFYAKCEIPPGDTPVTVQNQLTRADCNTVKLIRGKAMRVVALAQHVTINPALFRQA